LRAGRGAFLRERYLALFPDGPGRLAPRLGELAGRRCYGRLEQGRDTALVVAAEHRVQDLVDDGAGGTGDGRPDPDLARIRGASQEPQRLEVEPSRS